MRVQTAGVSASFDEFGEFGGRVGRDDAAAGVDHGAFGFPDRAGRRGGSGRCDLR